MKRSDEDQSMIKHFGWITVLLWACLLLSTPGWAQENSADGWPKEIKVPQGVVVMYQPQPEKLDGNRLEARAAVDLELKGSSEPVFGAVWFEARLDTDRAERTADIADVSVTRVRFPEQDEDKSKKLRALLLIVDTIQRNGQQHPGNGQNEKLVTLY